MLSPASQPEQLIHSIGGIGDSTIGSGLSSNPLFNPLTSSHPLSGQLDASADRFLQQVLRPTGGTGHALETGDRASISLSTPRSSTVDDLTGQGIGSTYVGANTVNLYDSATPRQTLNSAKDLGVVQGIRRVNGALRGSHLTHSYEIKLNTTSNLRLNLKGLKANADLFLVQDANHNGLVDRGEVLYLSNATGKASELIRINGLAAGTYYVQVAQKGGNTNYQLSMQARQTEPGLDLSKSADLGILKGRGSTTGSVDDLDTDDMYRFRLDSASDLNLRLSGLSRNADLYLVQDVNNNARMDASDILARSLRVGPSPENIQVNDLSAGTYFALVGQQRGSTNYTLTWTVDGAGEDMGSAQDLGVLNGSTTLVDFVGESDPADFYQFSLNCTNDVTVTLDQLTADADLFVVQDANGNGVVDEEDVLASSLKTGSTAESIVLEDLAAGDYFVYVNEYNDSTNYQLTLETQAGNGNGVRTVAGDFRANTFNYLDGYQYTVISGNGNVDFGSGQRDVLDLSEFSSTAVDINLANTHGGGVVFDPGNGDRLFDAITLADGSQILFEGIDTIRFANTTMNLSVVPNDPLFNQQWNLHMMDVDGAWRFTTGTSDVLIGVQDTGLGVDENGDIHPDLGRTSIHYGNYEDETLDQLSHGTAVQSIIAAASNNGSGMSGINWNSNVFALDVISGNDAGDYGLGTAAQFMIAMADDSNQKLVVNMSLSGGSDSLFEQLVAANQNDVLFVIASGNEDRSSISSPSILANSYQNVMAVGASWGTTDYYGNPTTPGTRISYSGWWGSNYGTGLSIMGPSEVVAADATASSWFGTSFDFTTTFNGTSAATPNVTGVASLVWSANPNLTAVQVHDILAATAIDLGNPGYDTEYGSGFVNAESAVRMALAMA